MQKTQEIQVQSLGQEDGIAIHSSILAWKIPRTEEPVGLQSKGSQKSQTEVTEHAWNTIIKKKKKI